MFRNNPRRPPPGSPNRMISRRQFLRWTAGLGFAAALVPAYAFGMGPLQPPRITRYTVTPRRWPAGLTLNVAVLTDFHACEPWMSASRIGSIVETTNQLGADLIVLLGDYAPGPGHRFVS